MSFIGCTTWKSTIGAGGHQHRGHRAGQRPAQRARRQKRQPHQQRAGDRRHGKQRVRTAEFHHRRKQQREPRRADRRRRRGIGLRGNKAAGRERLRRVRPGHLRLERAGRLQPAGRERIGHQRVAGRIGSARRVGAARNADGSKADAAVIRAMARQNRNAGLKASPAIDLGAWTLTFEIGTSPARRSRESRRASRSSCRWRGCAGRSAPAARRCGGPGAAAWR